MYKKQLGVPRRYCSHLKFKKRGGPWIYGSFLTIKNYLQSYSWWKDIISVILTITANKTSGNIKYMHHCIDEAWETPNF